MSEKEDEEEENEMSSAKIVSPSIWTCEICHRNSHTQSAYENHACKG